jgi:sugar/nucleoside kinase (ribokinase family)
MKRIFIVGDVAVEILLRGLSGHPRRGREVFLSGARAEPGGAAGRFAAALTRFGRRVTLVGKVGKDPMGELVRRGLRGVVDRAQLAVDPARETGMRLRFSDDEESSVLTSPGATATLDARDVASLPFRRDDHLHVASPFLLPGLPLPAVFRKARARGVTISVGVGGDPRGRSDLKALCPWVQVLLLGEAEAGGMAGARAIAGEGPLVIVRRGGKGAVGLTGGKEWKVRGRATGPAFDAAFIDGWLDGHRVHEVLAYASSASALDAEGDGRIGSTPTRAEALRAVGRNV